MKGNGTASVTLILHLICSVLITQFFFSMCKSKDSSSSALAKINIQLSFDMARAGARPACLALCH